MNVSRPWIPAFAGMTEKGWMLAPNPSFPRRRESRLATLSAPSPDLRVWIPAFAGMTVRGIV